MALTGPALGRYGTLTEWLSPVLNLVPGRIEALGAGGAVVHEMWTSGSSRNRFDVYYTDATGVERILRIDGAGRSVRDRPETDRFANGAVFETLTTVHQTLFAGSAGSWIIGISGALLFSNLLIGLRLAWPSGRAGWRVLLRRSSLSGRNLWQLWHRRVGMCLFIPALVVAGAGTLLAFNSEVENLLRATPAEPKSNLVHWNGGSTVGVAPVISAALAREGGAALVAVIMPEPVNPWFRVRLLTRHERPRIWGNTTLYFDPSDARLLMEKRAIDAPAARAFMDALYPLHTGQIGGVPTRLVVLLTGAGMLLLMALGLRTWLARVRSRRSWQ
jgi:uncharacterized iron-regulated membrane protein